MDPELDPLAQFIPSPTGGVSAKEKGNPISTVSYPSLDDFFPWKGGSPSTSEIESKDPNLHAKKEQHAPESQTTTDDLLGLSESPQKSQKAVLVDRATLQPLAPSQPSKTKPKNPFLVEPSSSAQKLYSPSNSEVEPEEKKPSTKKKTGDERKRMEEEFGRQRKKFMTQMLQMESELNRFKQLLLKKEQECFILKGDLESKDQEMDDVRAAAAVSESLLKESFRDEHKQMVDEINSLKQIVKVTAEDSYNVSTLQKERTTWNLERQRLQNEIAQLQQSQMNQQTATRLSDLSTSNQFSQPTPPQPASSTHQQAPRLARAESLEKHMEKAHEESEKLRAVVIPLEEEIAFLKAKLGQKENKIKSLEGSSSVGQLIDITSDEEHTGPLLDGEPEVGEHQLSLKEDKENRGDLAEEKQKDVPAGQVAELPQPAEKKQEKPDKPKKSKIQKLLDKERSLRSDVEIKLDVMTTQRNVLQGDLEKAHSEVANLCSLLDKEKQSKVDLTKTWELANLQFLELQQQYKTELEQLKDQLSGSRPVSSTSETVQSDSVSISKEDLLDGSQEITNSTTLSTSSEVQEKSESGSQQDGVPFTRDMDDLMMMSPPDQPASFSSGSVSGLDTLLSQLAAMKTQLSAKEQTCKKLQTELKKLKSSYEEETQQKDEIVRKLESDISKYQAAMAQEQSERKLWEKKMAKLKDEVATRVSTFEESVRNTRLELKQGREDFAKLKLDTQEEVMRLSKEREDIWSKVKSAREEYACLKQQHLMELEEQARRMTMAEVAQKEAETNVATTVEQLSITQSQMIREKETLLSEVTHLRKQLLKEQEEKRAVKSQVEIEMATCSSKIDMWQTKCSKLEENIKSRQEAIAVAEEFKEKTQNTLTEKNKEIHRLNQQIDTLKAHLMYKNTTTL